LKKLYPEMNKEKEDSGKKNTKTSKSPIKSKSFITDERIKFVIGILITGFAIYLLLACVAFLFWWKTDLSIADSDIVSGPDIAVKNWSGKSGHFLAKMIINNGFGFGAFFIPLIFGTIGLYLLKFPNIKPFKLIAKFSFATIILSLILGFIFSKSNVYLGSGPGGAQGYHIVKWMNAFMGMIGTGIILTFITISYLVFALRVKPESFGFKLPAFLKFKKHRDGQNLVMGSDTLTEPGLTR
jgi:S-DNA-T family DNA segregation ATPase FtsK/SpoIIIE